MQHSSYAHKKNFSKESITTAFLRAVLAATQYIFYVGSFVLISLGGVLLFLLDFAMVKSAATFIFARLSIYLTAQYLTMLPTYIVIPLVLLPVKFSLPITLIVSIFSLFVSLSV